MAAGFGASAGHEVLSAAPAPQPSFHWIQANILATKCVSCHGSARAESNINLESYALLQASAAAHGHSLIEPGDPEQSHLYEALASGEMPEGGPRLSDAELGAVRDWIRSGAKND